ncbi:2761_t:CDS:2 [Ambispora leptoticha]|uniref:2761_t:CDS:1 n=1 Tax=Ambispora leptoticha TaxID=144679 RepID=A0A9N9D369_9GLOM|nr:2761_t:CDS:2 [Ambispora leptoticha]
MRILSKSNKSNNNTVSDFEEKEQEQNETRHGDIKDLGKKDGPKSSSTPAVVTESESRPRFRLFGGKPVAATNKNSSNNDSNGNLTNSVSTVSKTPTNPPTTPYVKKTRKLLELEVENHKKLTSKNEKQDEISQDEIDLLILEELSGQNEDNADSKKDFSVKNSLTETIDSKHKRIPRDEKSLDKNDYMLKKKRARSSFPELDISDLDIPDIPPTSTISVPAIPSYSTNNKNTNNPFVGPIINYEDDDEDIDSLVSQFQDEVKLETQYEQSRKDIDKELLDRYKLLKVGIGGGTPINVAKLNAISKAKEAKAKKEKSASEKNGAKNTKDIKKNSSDKKVAELGPPPKPIDPMEFGYSLDDDTNHLSKYADSDMKKHKYEKFKENNLIRRSSIKVQGDKQYKGLFF